MKKLFLIFSSIFTGIVVVILSVTCFVYHDNGVELGLPRQISVYYRSANALGTNGYYEGRDETLEGDDYENQSYDEEYYDILDKLESTTNLSLMKWLVEEGNFEINPEYNPVGYNRYDSSMKQENLVVEIIYPETRDVVVYDGENARVIPVVCLLFVIPINYNYEEIMVYTSLTADSNQKESQYTSNTPFALKGDPSELIEYVESL